MTYQLGEVVRARWFSFPYGVVNLILPDGRYGIVTIDRNGHEAAWPCVVQPGDLLPLSDTD